MKVLKLIGILAPADEIITALVEGIGRIDSDFIEGVYITGSIPLNDFHPDKSDIDFVILCSEIPNVAFQLRLNEVHQKIQKRFKKPDLSGCYITSADLQSSYPETIDVLSFHEGKLSLSKFGMAPVTLYELKNTAYTVYGIRGSDLPIASTLKDLHDFMYHNINSYWRNWIKKGFGFNSLLLLFIPRFTEWIILGVARQLHTLETGKIISKTEAGYYFLSFLPKQFHSIVHEAIRIRADKHPYLFSTIKPSYYILPSRKRATDTIACANFIIDLFNQTYCKQHGS